MTETEKELEDCYASPPPHLGETRAQHKHDSPAPKKKQCHSKRFTVPKRITYLCSAGSSFQGGNNKNNRQNILEKKNTPNLPTIFGKVQKKVQASYLPP